MDGPVVTQLANVQNVLQTSLCHRLTFFLITVVASIRYLNSEQLWMLNAENQCNCKIKAERSGLQLPKYHPDTRSNTPVLTSVYSKSLSCNDIFCEVIPIVIKIVFVRLQFAKFTTALCSLSECIYNMIPPMSTNHLNHLIIYIIITLS